jgi:hypothetical protein
MTRSRRLTRVRTLLTGQLCALLALGALLGACDPDAPTPTAAEVMAQETARLQWPTAAPSFDAIRRFVRAVGGTTPVNVVADRANVCAWYGEWLATYERGAPASPSVLSYMTDVIPTLEFVRGSTSAVDSMRQVATAARAGNPEPLRQFLEMNDCASLSGNQATAGRQN